MRVKVCLMVLVVLGMSAVAGAQIVNETQFFPVVAHTAGAGDPPTSWRSDLTVHNVTDGVLTVGVVYFPSGEDIVWDGTYNGTYAETVTLQPRETKTYVDIVATLFGVTSSSKGSLLLECDDSIFPSNPDGAMMVAHTRTYNVGSEIGTFGTSVPTAQYSSAFLNAGQSISLITGVRNDSDYRSNLGIVNFSFAEVPITVHYRFLNEGGVEIASGSKTLGVMNMDQWSFRKLGVPKTVDGPLTVELWLDPDDIPGDPCEIEEDDLVIFIAYATKVDGNPTGSGDGEFIYATPLGQIDCDE
ncbi:MAG: hypothetical protein LJE93_10335 [Acidobacteria bacterium]|nr:hypothetical protein [Acidobacteriota bacterium]